VTIKVTQNAESFDRVIKTQVWYWEGRSGVGIGPKTCNTD